MTACKAVTGRIFSRHNCRGHPESQERLDAVINAIPRDVEVTGPEPAGFRDLARVHDEQYISAIQARSGECPAGTCQYLDTDTYITEFSYETALLAAGSAIQSVKIVFEGSNCFALVRPPGHHAGKKHAMGFCIFNNAAVSAAYALERCDKVAIVDWDVHHGNGTQEIFYDSDRVLYCSIHEMHQFPNTGWPEETGYGPGEGYTVNVPLPPGSAMAEYRTALERRIIPEIRKYSPDIIIVSAGQDCLCDDPLGNMNLIPSDFGEMTRMIARCGPGPLALILEGGYGPSHGMAVSSVFYSLTHSEELR